MSKRLAISEVFTPRGSMNEVMYVERSDLENELRRGLKTGLNALLHGESGNGKSWLYQRVMKEAGYYHVPVGSTFSQKYESIEKAIFHAVFPTGLVTKTETKDTMTSGGTVGSNQLLQGKAELSSQSTYEFGGGKSPLLIAFEKIRNRAGAKDAFVVIENLEHIYSSEKLMTELGGIILLLDDPSFVKSKVRLLIVGTPRDVLAYYARIPHLSSIKNRIAEISEVGNLAEPQVHELVVRGFKELLSVSIPKDVLEEYKSHIYSMTLGNAQSVQAYCACLATRCEERHWNAVVGDLALADIDWLKLSAKSEYQFITHLMNSKESTVGRRNQVLYSLGRMNKMTFTYSEVEAVLRREFKDSTQSITLAVGQMLSEISKADNSIICTTPTGNAYTFTNPLHRMALRTMLKKLAGDKVEKIDL